MEKGKKWLLVGDTYDKEINASTRIVRDCVDVMVNMNMGTYYEIEIEMDDSCNEECHEMYALLIKNEEEKKNVKGIR